MPKTTCLPFSQLVSTVVMKNWEPFLGKLHVRKAHSNGSRSSSRVRAGIGHRKHEWELVLVLEVLICELFTVDGFSAGTLWLR